MLRKLQGGSALRAERQRDPDRGEAIQIPMLLNSMKPEG